MPWAEASLVSSGSKARPAHLPDSYQSESYADDIIPSGTVTARLHQLHGLAHPDQRSSNTPLMDLDRENTIIGWGQRSACYFAHASYSQWLAAGSCLAHHDHAFVEHRSARKKHSDAHGVTRDYRDGHSCRLRISDCHACRPCVSLTLRNSLSTGQIRGPGITAPSATSHDSATVTGSKRRESARSLFEEYGIARPVGWLSDEEDLSLSGDGNASPRKFFRVCHVCAAQTRSSKECLACGHRICDRCLSEGSSLGGESRQAPRHPDPRIRKDDPSHTQPQANPSGLVGSSQAKRRESKPWPAPGTNTLRPQPTWSVKANPFVVADKKAKDATSGHHISEGGMASVQGQTRKRRRDLQSRVASEEGPWECKNAACRRTHEGHRPFRHSILCALHRSNEADDTDYDLQESDAACDSSMEQVHEKEMAAVEALHAHHETIHRHHSTGFHGPHHIAEHLAIAMGHNRRAARSKLAYQSSISPEPDERISSGGNGSPITKPTIPAMASHLKPISSVQPIAEVDSFQYVEVPLPHDHDNVRPEKHKQHIAGSSPSQRLDAPPPPQLHVPQASHGLSQPLGHVESTRPLGGRAGVKTWLHSNSEEHPQAGSTEEHRLKSRQAPPSELSEHWEERNDGWRGAPSPRGWLQDTEVPRFDEKSTSQPHQSPKIRPGSLRRRANALAKTTERRSPSIQMYTDKVGKPIRDSLHDALEIIEDPSIEDNTDTGRKPPIEIHGGSRCAEQDVVSSQQKGTVPKARIASPPAWLKTPGKQVRDSISSLRHIKTQSHKNFSDHNQEQEAPLEHPSSLAPPTRHQTNTAKQASDTNIRPSSKDTSTVSLGATKRFQTDSGMWLGRRPELEVQTTQPNTKSVLLAPPPEHCQGGQRPCTAEMQATPLYAQTRSTVSDRCIFCEAPTPTPSIGHTLHIQGHSDEPPNPSTSIASDRPTDISRTLEVAHEGCRRATMRAQAELDQLRHVVESQDRRWDSSAPFTREDRATASGFTAVSTRRESLPFEDRASDLELHRPTPIAPPNHSCSWKDRYMALTAEIRLLKAQMTDRVSSGEADTENAVQNHESRPEEDLGIQGLTIVMHLKGKDDLVINTDLTQDGGEGDE